MIQGNTHVQLCVRRVYEILHFYFQLLHSLNFNSHALKIMISWTQSIKFIKTLRFSYMNSVQPIWLTMHLNIARESRRVEQF